MKKLCVVGLFILIAAGCGTQPHPVDTPTCTAPSSPLVTPIEELSSPLPGPTLTPTAMPSPTPTPPPIPSPTPIPTPMPTKGAITGQLIGRESGRPEGGLIVYLGDISYLQPNSIPIITMRQRASPHTMTDESGNFAFLDLEPGTYALILWTPVNSLVINDPETGKGLLVTVEAGAIIELGEITVNLP